MIIIEGSDKVGKTTLCNQFTETNGPLIHFSIPPQGWDFFWDYAARADIRTIWDRGWLSDIAYSTILGRQPGVTQEHKISIIHALRLFGAVNVVVVCDHELLLSRLLDCPDDKFDKATILAVNQWFIDTWMSYNTDIIIRCDRRKPYPSKTDIARINELHERRVQIMLNSIGPGLCLAKNLRRRALDAEAWQSIGSSLDQNEKQPG